MSPPSPEIPRQDVLPGGDDYSDGFYARMYGALGAFGLNEQRLVWMRYSGFLVLQGFILNVVSRDTLNPVLGLLLTALGILCSASWHVLNHAGWINQNVWFSLTAGFRFTKVSVPLPTDWWTQRRALKPTGRIYRIAQAAPVAFVIVYCVIAALALDDVGASTPLSVAILVVALAVTVIGVQVVERSELKDREDAEDDRTIA